MQFYIRQAEARDGAAIARIYAPYVTGTPITFEEIPPDGAEMCRRIAQTLKTYPFLVAESAGEVLGYACGSAHNERASFRWSVNVAIYLSQSHYRRGIGKSLYGVLLPLLTAQNFVTAYASIALPNAASIALHESVGFTPFAVYKNVGYKLGHWRDAGWWQRSLNPAIPNPPEPTPWTKMPEFQSLSINADP